MLMHSNPNSSRDCSNSLIQYLEGSPISSDVGRTRRSMVDKAFFAIDYLWINIFPGTLYGTTSSKEPLGFMAGRAYIRLYKVEGTLLIDWFDFILGGNTETGFIQLLSATHTNRQKSSIGEF